MNKYKKYNVAMEQEFSRISDNLFVIIVIFLIGIIVFSGCSKMRVGKPDIQSVTLTDQEKVLLSNVGVDQTFSFDVNMKGKSYDAVELRVDYFENGVYQETVMSLSMSGIREEFLSNDGIERIVWAESNLMGIGEELWSLSFLGGRAKQTFDFREQRNVSMSAQALQVDTITPNEDVKMAAIVGSAGSSLRSPGIIFSEKNEEEPLRNYEHAYVLIGIFR